MNHSLAALTSGGVLAAAASTIAIAINNNDVLKKIEVLFYDKSSEEKKLRLNLEYLTRSSKNSSAEYWDTEKSEWKSITEGKDQVMYSKLYDIAAKYIQTQHNLNIVKTFSQSENENKDLTNLCKNQQSKDCCCKDPANCKSGKCTTCICCYSDNAASDQADKCCCEGGTCTWTEFNKKQKTFNYLIKNLKAGEQGIYFQPVQAHIKLTESQFTDLNGTGSGESAGGSSSSTDQYKSFLGTLTYGFVDYYYKPTNYKQDLLEKGKESEYMTLSTESNKPNYFSNIPQRFKFSTSTSTSTESTTSEPKSNIEKIFTTTQDKNWIKNKAKKTTVDQNANTTDWCCCCDDNGNNDYIDCLLKRNFAFLEKETNALTNIQSKIKEAEDCCNKVQ